MKQMLMMNGLTKVQGIHLTVREDVADFIYNEIANFL